MISNTPHSDLHSDPCFAESDNRDLNEFVQEYPRVEYAGVELRTEASQQFIRTDNAKVRVPFVNSGRGAREYQMYGSILRILTHQAWEEETVPPSPVICVLEVEWYATIRTNLVSGNPLVRKEAPGVHSKFVTIWNCYQLPVAVWPFDLLGLLPLTDPDHDLLEVTDRNQDQKV
jgi:hypothetical protein